MFTPLQPQVIESVKSEGSISFFVFHGWEFIAVHGTFTTVPHKVVYVKKGTGDNHIRLSDCKLSLEKHDLIIEDLEPLWYPMSKPMSYMFLEMIVDEAENMANYSGKSRLSISSTIPQFSEIASERGFTIGKRTFTNCFKAQKMIERK